MNSGQQELSESEEQEVCGGIGQRLERTGMYCGPGDVAQR